MRRSALPMKNVNKVQATCAAAANGMTLQVSESWTNTSLASNAVQATALPFSQLYPVGDLIRCNGTNNIQFGAVALTNVATTPFIEPLQMYSSQSANTFSNQSYQIELSAFKDTLMELNKNIYFGDNLVLTINWNPANKFTFQTVGAGFKIPLLLLSLQPVPLLFPVYIYTQLLKPTQLLYPNLWHLFPMVNSV